MHVGFLDARLVAHVGGHQLLLVQLRLVLYVEFPAALVGGWVVRALGSRVRERG